MGLITVLTGHQNKPQNANIFRTILYINSSDFIERTKRNYMDILQFI